MSNPNGVAHFYYSKTLPARSVGIAQISVPALSPAQLTDVNNTVYDQGLLGVWLSTTGVTSTPDFPAPALNIPVTISGSLTYYVGSQFFELTNILADDSITPLFYVHVLPNGATHPRVLDLDGDDFTSSVKQVSSTVGGVTTVTLYHSLDGAPYRVQFIDSTGSLVDQVLQYTHVIARSIVSVYAGVYNLIGSLLTLPDTGDYYVRFTADNGYQVMPTYTYLPNVPWYPRVRYGLTPPPVDYALQPFVGGTIPWLQAVYVAGTVLDSHMIQFERTNVFNDGAHWPDILIFDKDNNFKYALDGYVGSASSTLDTPFLKGTVYPWQRGKLVSMDSTFARVDVAVELDPTDIVWGFYNYAEQDVIYTAFDCNPFTNTNAKNTILQLYLKLSGGAPNRNIYHQLLDASGNAIAGQTNDPSPGSGTNHVFAQVVVGASVSEDEFSFTDSRVRGGGLATKYWATVPQAVNFWDIGYWDGRPYPIGGACAIYLPYSILDTLSRTDVKGRVNSILPMGAIAVIRYIDDNGMEWV